MLVSALPNYIITLTFKNILKDRFVNCRITDMHIVNVGLFVATIIRVQRQKTLPLLLVIEDR